MPVDATTPAQQLSELRATRAAARRRPYRASRLDCHRAELIALRSAGASLGELAHWLRTHRIRVHRSTILRALRRWPESPDAAQEADHAET